MKVHLIDGTYELFRRYYGLPAKARESGATRAGARAVVAATLQLLEEGATHVGVATDHVIESFRNDMWAGYKDGSGIDPILLGQFELLEESLAALGVTVWPMVELEADDALATGAQVASEEPTVDRVIITTADKDVTQCVRGDRVVQYVP